jgi:acyl carrier protein
MERIAMQGKIIQLLKEIRPEFDFTTSEDFVAEGMLDSLDIVALVDGLDHAYGISIAGTEIVPENFRNLSTIAALVERQGGSR